jgi:hypothetical protein
VTWNGDISSMGQLADRIADLAEIPSRIAARVSPQIEALIVEEFAEGKDPYGSSWEPLAEATLDKGRTPPPLNDTGAMLGSLSVRTMRGAGIQITIDHPSAPHQTGWEGPQGEGPARPILPARGELPIAYTEIVDREIKNEIRRRRRA